MAKEVDCTNASRPVWLVKVPKYLAAVFNNADESGSVGTLYINKNPKDKEVVFQLTENLAQSSSDNTPNEYKLNLLEEEQSRAVILEKVKTDTGDDKMAGVDDDEEKQKVDTYLEGIVAKRGDFRATHTPQYMNLKRNSILSAIAPSRKVQQLQNVVSNVYKPISQHKPDEEHEKRKKQEGKRARADKDYVLELLFKAFERHQYYYMKDLIKITQQPLDHLKEILKSICIYNTKNPHKNMWELKPEYRHYDEKETTIE
ncbi:general transcription factor IIF subunit 2-like isoform X1 [Xenia sp. Carnegie-2017]|uniref:general transcription factor IIF subunit 2-like isoform X1 n=1 Tax=Xenia sp. Carnegie-2017 TaxID=2897299 RepID=UPI001F03F62D|nr:general transcription factor IIF subunit 2-like isoform X1 [Xenia sp. Carnegie-2017]